MLTPFTELCVAPGDVADAAAWLCSCRATSERRGSMYLIVTQMAKPNPQCNPNEKPGMHSRVKP